MERSVKVTFCTSISIGLFMLGLVSERSIYAQGERGIRNNPSGPFTEALERRDREVALRSLPVRIRENKTNPRVSGEVLKRTSDDFTRIQIIRLEMVRDIAAGKRFEYKRLSDDASEIRKRAGRLKTSLALFDQQTPYREDSFVRVELDGQKIQEAAFQLCLEISRFVENPIFKSTGAYRVQDAAEAGRTLDTVINLSLNIEDSAERLRKSGQ